MTHPLVSIIIPCYNVEDYIAECLESAINQTYENIEIIAVDNNSTDGSLRILKRYQQQYPDLITVLEEKKQGASAARNKGLSVAKGEWIQFLDADDIIFCEKIRHQVNIISSEGHSLVFTASPYFTKVGKKQKLAEFNTFGDPIKNITYGLLGNMNSNLFKKSEIDSLGCFDETLIAAEDTDLFFRLLFNNPKKYVYIDEKPLSVYNKDRKGQITTSKIELVAEFDFFVRLKIVNFLKENMPQYYKENRVFYECMIYKFISRIWINDKIKGKLLLKDSLGLNYHPQNIKPFISMQNSIGVKFLGNSGYFYVREVIKAIYRKLLFRSIP